MLVTVMERGRLTIPKAIRDQFGIETGSKLNFEPQADGTLRLRVLVRGAASLFGILRKNNASTKTIEEMDSGIAKAASSRIKRTKA